MSRLVSSIKNAVDVSEAIYSGKIQKIKDEMNKTNPEGDLIYSKSEIDVFNKVLAILEGRDE